MFHLFINLVKWILFLIGIIIGLVLAKHAYDKGMEKCSRERAKRSRRGKRKRKEDMEGDGLGFAGGVTYSDSEEDEE